MRGDRLAGTFPFRLAYVPGVTPAKWVRIWQERLPGVPLDLVPVPAEEAAGLLRARGADAGFVRLPIDRTDLSAIPLYTETTVVVVPKDHLVAAVEEVSAADLADEIVLHPLDDTLGWEQPPAAPRGSAPRPRRTRSNWSPPGWACWPSPSRWPACTTAGTSPTAR